MTYQRIEEWGTEFRNHSSSFSTNYGWRTMFVGLQIGSFFAVKTIIDNKYYNKLFLLFGQEATTSHVNSKRMKLLLTCTGIRVTRQIFWSLKLLRFSMHPFMALMWPTMSTILDILGVMMAVKCKDKPKEKLNWMDKIGFALFIFGCILESGHDLLMNTFKSKSENKGKIYTGGFANFIVHPNYSGYCLWRSGLAMISQNWWFSGVVTTMFWSNFIMSSGPELRGFCCKKYGDKYIQYINRTYKFIPFIY
eukprot:164053_1